MSVARPQDFVETPTTGRGATERDLVRGVVNAVAYRDVFRFPMTASEIHRFVQSYTTSRDDTEAALATALAENLLSTDGEYYALTGREVLFNARKE